jgi:hypothetical protein
MAKDNDVNKFYFYYEDRIFLYQYIFQYTIQGRNPLWNNVEIWQEY